MKPSSSQVPKSSSFKEACDTLQLRILSDEEEDDY